MENLYYKHQNVLGHGELKQTGAYPFWCITADVSVAYHFWGYWHSCVVICLVEVVEILSTGSSIKCMMNVTFFKSDWLKMQRTLCGKTLQLPCI